MIAIIREIFFKKKPLLNQFFNNKLSAIIQRNMKACQRCLVQTNLVTCLECQSLFCYICSQILHSIGKYRNHNLRKSPSTIKKTDSATISTSLQIISQRSNALKLQFANISQNIIKMKEYWVSQITQKFGLLLLQLETYEKITIQTISHQFQKVKEGYDLKNIDYIASIKFNPPNFQVFQKQLKEMNLTKIYLREERNELRNRSISVLKMCQNRLDDNSKTPKNKSKLNLNATSSNSKKVSDAKNKSYTAVPLLLSKPHGKILQEENDSKLHLKRNPSRISFKLPQKKIQKSCRQNLFEKDLEFPIVRKLDLNESLSELPVHYTLLDKEIR